MSERTKEADPRETTADISEVDGKTWFRTLDEAVIEADRCVECGSCVAACPSDSIGMDDVRQQPTLVRMCTGCSRCWDFCPRAGLRYESLKLGNGEPDVYSAVASRDVDGQDGGAVTALLAELLRKGEIDGAVIATESERSMEGEAFLATSVEELVRNAGSFYNQTMQLGHVNDLVSDSPLSDPNLALVGTPCVAQGAEALERYPWDGDNPVALTVSLMCTRNFDYDLMTVLFAEKEVGLEDVDKLDVIKGELHVYDEDGDVLLVEDVDEFESAALRGCEECADFVGESADISAGSVGSPDGCTTMVVRTEEGRQAWEKSREAFEYEAIHDKGALERISEWNEERAEEALERKLDPDADINISLAEHLEAYEGSDRAPEPANSVRVHQYVDRC